MFYVKSSRVPDSYVHPEYVQVMSCLRTVVMLRKGLETYHMAHLLSLPRKQSCRYGSHIDVVIERLPKAPVLLGESMAGLEDCLWIWNLKSSAYVETIYH